MEKRGPSDTVDGNVTWYSHYEKMIHYDEMFGWHHQLTGYEFTKRQEIVKDREAWPGAVHGV